MHLSSGDNSSLYDVRYNIDDLTNGARIPKEGWSVGVLENRYTLEEISVATYAEVIVTGRSDTSIVNHAASI